MHNWLRVFLGLVIPLAPVMAQETFKGVPEVNPFSSEADVKEGASLFSLHCSYCHGVRGEGGRGADLTAGVYRMGGKDSELYKTIRIGIPGTEMPAVRVTDDEVWKLVGWVKHLGSEGLSEKATGDPVAGKALYTKNGCAACHKNGADGRDLGPELTDVGRRRGLAYLEESMVKPEAFVAPTFRAVQVVMKTGPAVTGIRLNEDDLSVQVRDMTGNLRSFLKENVKEVLRDKPSVMPSYARLSKAELNDLVAYLHSLKGAQ